MRRALRAAGMRRALRAAARAAGPRRVLNAEARAAGPRRRAPAGALRPALAGWVAAAALALYSSPEAAAAAEPREPVVGGGSFATAPILETGRYRDTLLPAERLFYGVRLEPGQQLRVRAMMLEDDNEAYAYDSFGVGIETPAREVEVLDAVERDLAGNGTIGDGDRGDPIEFVTPAVETLSTGLDDFSSYGGPGVWYVSLYLPTSDEEPRRREFPVALELEVLGEPQEDAAPDPTPGPERTPSPAPAGSGGDDGDGAPVAAAVGVGGAGVLAGFAAGALLARRRRPA
jgi:Ca-activated chloride channel family protein